MRLTKNWKKVLVRAWSSQLMYVALFLTGVEIFLPLAQDYGWLMWMPLGVFAILSALVIVGALVARVLLQEQLHDSYEEYLDEYTA